jgi:hypothetical protein
MKFEGRRMKKGGEVGNRQQAEAGAGWIQDSRFNIQDCEAAETKDIPPRVA